MSEKYVLAIDQGTTSTRCLIFDQRTRVASFDQIEHRQIFPRPGWVEHDPLEIWTNTEKVIGRALQKAAVSADRLAAVGITNQRETTVAWNRSSGVPYCNAIVWQCTRSQEICDSLAKEGGVERFRHKTGLPLSAYFSGPKIKWILENVSGVREAARKGEALFGTIDSWLIWWMTGGPQRGRHLTDVTNASRTLMMNLSTLDWDPQILEILEIPRSTLPEIRPSCDPQGFGLTDSDGPLKAAVPICGVLGDQQSALVGQACFQAGETKNTYGTGCFMLMNTGQRPVESRSGLLTSLGYQILDQAPVFCLEGSVAIAGALVQWLRDNLGLIHSSVEVEALARSVADNGGVYFVPAFSGLLAPYWRADARGVVAGLTRFANKGHIARAALEATAYQSRDVLEAMEREAGIKLNALKVDGGMVKNELLMQFQADILNRPVVRSDMSETTALGAAFLAGLAVGFWSRLEELRTFWNADKTWQPGMTASARDGLLSNWHKAVQRSLDWLPGEDQSPR
jgi:glycerol kinase